MKKFLLGTISFGTLSFMLAGMVAAPTSRALAADSQDKIYADGLEALKKAVDTRS
jgi:hypothetical protein